MTNPFTINRLTIVKKDNLLALVTVKVADAIFLTGIRVIEGKNGPFVAMPNRKTKAGEYEDIFFAANRETRDQLHKLILDVYHAQ